MWYVVIRRKITKISANLRFFRCFFEEKLSTGGLRSVIFLRKHQRCFTLITPYKPTGAVRGRRSTTQPRPRRGRTAAVLYSPYRAEMQRGTLPPYCACRLVRGYELKIGGAKMSPCRAYRYCRIKASLQLFWNKFQKNRDIFGIYSKKVVLLSKILITIDDDRTNFKPKHSKCFAQKQSHYPVGRTANG